MTIQVARTREYNLHSAILASVHGHAKLNTAEKHDALTYIPVVRVFGDLFHPLVHALE